MNKFIFCALLTGLTLTSCQNENSSNENLLSPSNASSENEVAKVADDKNIIPGQYIVLFKDSKIASAAKQLERSAFTSRESKARSVEHVSRSSVRKIKSFLDDNKVDKSKVLNYYTTKISGMTVKLTDEEFDKLSRDESVQSIEFDRIVELPKFTKGKFVTDQEAKRGGFQGIPCGIKNVGGFTRATGKRSWIWIIDSGIDLDHPDLNVVTDPKYAKSFIEGETSADDCLGHGTHVAGIAAAIDNDFGVVGVSAGASVVPLKIYRSCEATTPFSTILKAIDHVGKFDTPGDVVNLSLGRSFSDKCNKNSIFKTALRSLTRKGAYVVMSAGNSREDAKNISPACVNGDRIYTIASMDCNRNFAHLSNFNMDPVDFIATGVDVHSTFVGGGYITFSGTSMAAPHVSGIIHARGRAPRASGFVSSRGENYPIAVR